MAPTERHKFQHQGRTIYSWNQTLQELNLFVEGPPGVRAKQLAVDITSTHLSIGIAGNPPYLSVSICARTRQRVCECADLTKTDKLHSCVLRSMTLLVA